MTQIEEAIVSGELEPEEKLPAERELMEMFKTSRGPVREALKALEQKKLVEIRPGSGGGAFVCRMGTDLLRETLGQLVRHRLVPPAHMTEFRVAIESLAARLAAERVTPEHLDVFDRTWTEMNNLFNEERFTTFWSRERGMHRLLAKASGNLMCEWVVDTIAQEIAVYGTLYPSQSDRAKEALADWSAIIKALKERQANQGSLMVSMHVVRFSLLNEA